MKNSILLEILAKLELNQTEASVFLYFYQNLPSRYTTLAKKLDISRMQLYRTINSLIKKGFLKKTKNQKYPDSVSSKTLLARLQAKTSEMTELSFEFGKLASLDKSKESNSKVKRYNTREKFIEIFNWILELKQDIYHLGTNGQFRDYVSQEFFHAWVKRRTDLKIWYRDIMTLAENLHMYQHDPSQFREIKLLPPGYQFDISFVIVADYFLVFNPIQNSVTIVKDYMISNNFKIIFKLIWDLLPEDNLFINSLEMPM